MKRQELAQHERIRPQKVSARETPHVTIEPNTTCNIRCAYCYCIEEAVVKTLDEVKAEIDLAITKRNLDTISLLGGEPTIHPDIVEIVRYVKAKGLVCMLLTNGVRFVIDRDEALLDRLVAAGVDRFLVHIDAGQKHVHGDIDRARHEMFSMLDARRVPYGLSVTLYHGQEDELPRIVKELARHPYFDGVLSTLAFDLDHAFDPKPNPLRPRPEMTDVYRAIQRDLRIEPAAYLPSSTDDDEVCWLMYFYFLNAETGATFALSPELNRGVKALYRKLNGHEFFGETMSRSWMPVSLAGAGAAELALHPSRVVELARLMRGAHGMAGLRFHYIVVQQAPRIDAAKGKVQICWQCPDATIRNGKLTPVCIAGRVNSLGGRPVTAPKEVVVQVLSHLGES
jgi:pyruvate-formate lyase-activating enzyme